MATPHNRSTQDQWPQRTGRRINPMPLLPSAAFRIAISSGCSSARNSCLAADGDQCRCDMEPDCDAACHREAGSSLMFTGCRDRYVHSRQPEYPGQRLRGTSQPARASTGRPVRRSMSGAIRRIATRAHSRRNRRFHPMSDQALATAFSGRAGGPEKSWSSCFGSLR